MERTSSAKLKQELSRSGSGTYKPAESGSLQKLKSKSENTTRSSSPISTAGPSFTKTESGRFLRMPSSGKEPPALAKANSSNIAKTESGRFLRMPSGDSNAQPGMGGSRNVSQRGFLNTLSSRKLGAENPNDAMMNKSTHEILTERLGGMNVGDAETLSREQSVRLVKMGDAYSVKLDKNALMAAGDNKSVSIRWAQMKESITKEPVMQLRKYRRGSPGQDLLVLYHNAIKREIQDIYYMMASMQKRLFDLVRHEIDEFLRWFELFGEFLEWYMNFEEKELFPFIQTLIFKAGKPVKSLALDPKYRTQLKQTVMRRLGDVDDSSELSLPAGEIYPQLVKKVDSFVLKLLEYIGFTETEMLPLLEGVGLDEDRDQMESNMFKNLHKQPDKKGHLYFHIILRGLKVDNDEVAVKDFRTRYLDQYPSLLSAIKIMRLKKEYNESKEQIRELHLNIVRDSFVRWNTGHAKVETSPFVEQVVTGGANSHMGAGNPSYMRSKSAPSPFKHEMDLNYYEFDFAKQPEKNAVGEGEEGEYEIMDTDEEEDVGPYEDEDEGPYEDDYYDEDGEEDEEENH